MKFKRSGVKISNRIDIEGNFKNVSKQNDPMKIRRFFGYSANRED